MFCCRPSDEKKSNLWLNTLGPIVTTVDIVDEKSNSSFNTVNPIITTLDNMDKNESSINADNFKDMHTSTTGTTTGIYGLSGVASLSLESTSKKAERSIRSDVSIRQAHRSVRRSLESSRSYVKTHAVRTGMAELEEADVHALLDSGLEEHLPRNRRSA